MGQLQQEIAFSIIDGQHPILCQQVQGFYAQGDVATRKDFQGNPLGRQPIPERIEVLQDDLFLVDGGKVHGLAIQQVNYNLLKGVASKWPLKREAPGKHLGLKLLKECTSEKSTPISGSSFTSCEKLAPD